MKTNGLVTPRRTRNRRILRTVSLALQRIQASSKAITRPSSNQDPTHLLTVADSMINVPSSPNIPLDLDVSLVNNSTNKTTLSSKPELLRNWALQHNITHVALSDLLKIIRTWLPFDNIPKDSRTLLRTPKCRDVYNIAGGEMFYFGVEDHVRHRIDQGYEMRFQSNISDLNQNNVISITVGIDGLPISKSSNTQFWPILGYLGSQKEDVFVIAIYCGKTKPVSANEFLDKFVVEMKELDNPGLVHEGISYSIRIRCIVADAPARSFIKCTIGHNGYYGCDRCYRRGQWNKRVIYPGNVTAEKHTDDTFRKYVHSKHHLGDTSLVLLNMGPVSQVVLDYMHLCCLGVMKKLLVLWTDTIPHKLKPRDITKISKRLVNFSNSIPYLFNRKCRSLSELKHWKATEFRLFLLYVGPFALHGILSETKFNHFILFHVAMYILVSPAANHIEWVEYASSLLLRFSEEFRHVYSKECCVYNVHMLNHLCDDVKLFGPLDNISAFPFENFMQSIKRMLRKNNNHLSQIVNRISEKKFNYTKTVMDSSIRVRKNERDNCFLTDDLRICILTHDDDTNCKVKYFLNQSSVSYYPINSAKLNIFIVSNIQLEESIISKSKLVKHCVLLSRKDILLSIPICHSII